VGQRIWSLATYDLWHVLLLTAVVKVCTCPHYWRCEIYRWR